MHEGLTMFGFDLDSIIDRTASNIAGGGSPRILSEEHNTGNITVEEGEVTAALSRLSGGGGRSWDAAEYGITREQAAAQLAAANTPEARERVVQEIKARAIRRASLDTTGGRVALYVAGEPAWHGLGVRVAEAVGSRDAIGLAGLDWRVRKQELGYLRPKADGTGDQWVKSRDVWGIVREDSGAMLGTVGSRYSPIQNADGFEFLDSVLAEFGAVYESAGSLYGGAKVFMLVKLPRQAFDAGAGDTVEPYCLFVNTHDGTGAAKCYPTTQRVVCANTLRLAESGRNGKGISIRHTGDVRAKVDDARAALGLTVRQVETFRDNVDVLQSTRVEPLPFINGLLDSILDITQSQMGFSPDALAAILNRQEQTERWTARMAEARQRERSAALADVLDRTMNSRNTLNGMGGTGWGVLNAVTESADHGALGGRFTRGTQEEQRSRRFESVMDGAADEIKQLAYERVLALATN